jgi:hypothetical protein
MNDQALLMAATVLEFDVAARICRMHMFNFLHPKPVVNRRPVAELVVRQEARAIINADTVLYALPRQHLQKVPLKEVNGRNLVIPPRSPKE